jgi:hypothetical protein
MRRLLNRWPGLRTNGSYFQDLFRRLLVRKGPELSIWAVAHRLLRVIWKVLHQKVCYVEHGPRSAHPKAIQKRKRALIRQLRGLGYSFQVTAIPIAHPARP